MFGAEKVCGNYEAGVIVTIKTSLLLRFTIDVAIINTITVITGTILLVVIVL